MIPTKDLKQMNGVVDNQSPKQTHEIPCHKVIFLFLQKHSNYSFTGKEMRAYLRSQGFQNPDASLTVYLNNAYHMYDQIQRCYSKREIYYNYQEQKENTCTSNSMNKEVNFFSKGLSVDDAY